MNSADVSVSRMMAPLHMLIDQLLVELEQERIRVAQLEQALAAKGSE